MNLGMLSIHIQLLQSFMTGGWSTCQYICKDQKVAFLGQAQELGSLAPLELVTSAAVCTFAAQTESPPLNDCSWSFFFSGSFACEPSGPEVVI